MTTAVETVTSNSEVMAVPDQLFRDDDNDKVDELPLPLQRSNTFNVNLAGSAQRRRHSKKLSLNFPILVPGTQDSPRTGNGSASNWSQSPTVPSPYRISTPPLGIPFPSPDEFKDGFNPTEGPDFLTLIAGQERRVMELKEELSKAESVLSNLKKQWAIFEAKKKQSELRNKTVRLGPVTPHSGDKSGEDEELERNRRREAREQKMRGLGMAESELGRSNSNNSRRSGGRVFAGRHTRTLSLLQNNNMAQDASNFTTRPKCGMESSSSNVQQSETLVPNQESLEHSKQEERNQARLSLSRQATLQELITSSATGAAQMNFGKTYKELAHASRKSLPPGTDVFMKQGKQVYDGVSQGFWNFVEDIRQATVGDEPVNGTAVEQRKEVKKPRSSKELNEDQAGGKHVRDGRGEINRRQKAGDKNKPEKDNFWKEFGIETPKNSRQAENKALRKGSGARAKEDSPSSKEHESKSSTDSKCPPSLLADLLDVNEDDDAWDNWPAESPVGSRQSEKHVGIRRVSLDDEEDAMPQVSLRREKQFSGKQRKAVEMSWAELTT